MLVVVGATLLGQPGYRIVGAVMLVAAAAVAGLFVLAEHRASAPLLPRTVRRNSHVLHGTTGAFLNTAATSSTATLITLYLQSTLRRTPLAAPRRCCRSASW